jgi:3D (Asp-Asp-Asp) domain-containing protein
MSFLIPVLVGLLVQPGSVTAPYAAEAAHAEVREEVAVVMDTPFVPASPEVVQTTISTKLTAYNAVPGQTDNTPFITAVGAFSNPEVIAARSKDLAHRLPYGTVIAIERTLADTPSCRHSVVEDQIGYRVIADAMNTRIINTVDVLLDQHKTVTVDGRTVNPGLALGRCAQVSVRIVGVIPISDIPATQDELRAMVEGETELAIR